MKTLAIFLVTICQIGFSFGVCPLPTCGTTCPKCEPKPGQPAVFPDNSKSPPTTTSPGSIWVEEFDNQEYLLNGWRWSTIQTSAYSCNDHNIGYNKLDLIKSDSFHLHVENNEVTFQAVKTRDPEIQLEDDGDGNNVAYWTGSMTTQYSNETFMVKTNNYIETYVQLPDKQGAWPALFTWKPEDDVWGANEVDVFEYHSDSPHVLELTSHLYDIKDANGRVVATEEPCRFDRTWIDKWAWVKIGTHLGRNKVSWYVNDEKVCERNGVPSDNWTAYIVFHLAVSAGACNEAPLAPTGADTLWFRSRYLQVHDTLPSHLVGLTINAGNTEVGLGIN